MRIQQALLAFGLMCCVSAQEPAQAPGKFYGSLVSGSWPLKQPRPNPVPVIATPAQTVSPCSVPLLEMPIPKEIIARTRWD